jgi:hypothetical protein
LKSSGYGLEFDLNADPHYDASGLGRIHREGAPSTICLSCPCPATPSYTVDIQKPFAFSACSAVKYNDTWLLGADTSSKYEIINTAITEDSASSKLLCRFENEKEIEESYCVSKEGIYISIKGEGDIGFALPAFCFDGETESKISLGKHYLTIEYNGWICCYTTDGYIVDLNKIAANRNGHYKAFLATAKDNLDIKIQILKK